MNTHRGRACYLSGQRNSLSQSGRHQHEPTAPLRRPGHLRRRGRPEGSDRRYPGVSRAKILKMNLLRLLVPFVRGQL